MIEILEANLGDVVIMWVRKDHIGVVDAIPEAEFQIDHGVVARLNVRGPAGRVIVPRMPILVISNESIPRRR